MTNNSYYSRGATVAAIVIVTIATIKLLKNKPTDDVTTDDATTDDATTDDVTTDSCVICLRDFTPEYGYENGKITLGCCNAEICATCFVDNVQESKNIECKQCSSLLFPNDIARHDETHCKYCTDTMYQSKNGQLKATADELENLDQDDNHDIFINSLRILYHNFKTQHWPEYFIIQLITTFPIVSTFDENDC